MIASSSMRVYYIWDAHLNFLERYGDAHLHHLEGDRDAYIHHLKRDRYAYLHSLKRDGDVHIYPLGVDRHGTFTIPKEMGIPTSIPLKGIGDAQLHHLK